MLSYGFKIRTRKYITLNTFAFLSISMINDKTRNLETIRRQLDVSENGPFLFAKSLTDDLPYFSNRESAYRATSI